MLETAPFDRAINEKCCNVAGGRGIYPFFLVPTGDLTAQGSPPPVIYQPSQKKKKKKKKKVEFVNSNFTLFCIGARLLQEFSKD